LTRTSTFFAFLILLLLVSSTFGGNLQVRLVNKIAEPREGPVSFDTGQVEIVFPDGRTRLLPYRTYLTPLVVNDRIYLFPAKEGQIRGMVIYQAESGGAKSFPLPEDLDPYFGSPSFSPDGAKIAYYRVKGDGRGEVRVRSFPGGKLLAQSQVLKLRPTDVPPEPPTWQSRARVEFDAEFFDPPRRVSLQLQD
jgi:hypothetical protein